MEFFQESWAVYKSKGVIGDHGAELCLAVLKDEFVALREWP